MTSLANLPRTLGGLSTAGKIAALVALFQLLTVALAIGVLVIGNERHVIQAWWHPYKLALLGALLILGPLFVFQAARLWLERETSRWPDILAAWNAALLELSHQRIAIKDVPLFIVLGGSSDEEEKRILADAPGELAVRASPAGAAGLHVWGGPDAVYVSLSRSSRLSDLSRRGSEENQNVAREEPRTLVTDHRGNVLGEGAGATGGGAVPATRSSGEDSAPLTGNPGSLRLREEMGMRLRYVCELVRRERGGLAPINGTLAILPWNMIERGDAETMAVGRALGEDLASLGRGMGLRAPVVALLLCTKPDAGLAEVILRTPPGERQSRIGQRFPTGLVATSDQLGTLAVRACGSLEDLILGRLLRAPDVLVQQDNAALVALVSRVRRDLSVRLAWILQRAFVAAEGDTTALPPFISGCYLAASGEGRDQQAFIGGALDKLLDSQGDLEWAPGVESSDIRALRLARLLWGISAAAAIAFATFLSRRMLWGA
jgi:hypothetical protein